MKEKIDFIETSIRYYWSKKHKRYMYKIIVGWTYGDDTYILETMEDIIYKKQAVIIRKYLENKDYSDHKSLALKTKELSILNQLQDQERYNGWEYLSPEWMDKLVQYQNYI